MLDPDPLYVAPSDMAGRWTIEYGILPTCAAQPHGYTVASRGHRHVVVGIAVVGFLLATLVLMKRDAPIDAVPQRRH